MKRHRIIRNIVSGLIFFMLSLCNMDVLFAQQSSDNYVIDTDVLSGGGRDCDSLNYYTISTLGQPSPIGASSSANYMNHAGFWYTLVAPEGLCDYLGDINTDCSVDISDVILVLRCALGLSIEPYQCLPCGDINGEGSVDISDVILTLRMALELDDKQPCAE